MTYDPAKALALIARIEESRRDFEREVKSRARLLSMLEPQGPTDPILAGIAESWRKLSEYHHQKTARYQRRFGKAPPPRERAVEMSRDKWSPDHWKYRWEYERGEQAFVPRSNFFNILLALRESPELSGIIGTDETTGKIMLKAPLPLRHDPTFDADFEMRPLLVADVSALREYLQFIGLSEASKEDVAAAVKLVAIDNAWRPSVDG